MSTVVAERSADAKADSPAGLAAQLWGRADVAQVFRVTAETVKKWERDGKLPPAIRIGRKPLWRREQIMELVKD